MDRLPFSYDLIDISRAFPPSHRKNLHLAIGSLHTYPVVEPGHSKTSLFDLREWFSALHDADQAMSALMRLRRPIYPIDKPITAAALKANIAHRYIERLATLVQLKQELDPSDPELQHQKANTTSRRPILNGWTWRPRLQAFLNIDSNPIVELLEALLASVEDPRDKKEKQAEKQQRRLQILEALNDIPNSCRRLLSDQAAHSVKTDTQANTLAQARRLEQEWTRQPQATCERWIRLSRHYIYQHGEIYATYCTLFLGPSSEINSDKYSWHHPKDEIKSSFAQFEKYLKTLINKIKETRPGLACFRKIDWSPQIGIHATLILLHSREQMNFRQPSPFDCVQRIWTGFAGGKITSPIPKNEIRPGSSCFRFKYGPLAIDFESSLKFLTLSNQCARIHSNSQVKLFSCQSFQNERPKAPKLNLTKALITEIRLQRGLVAQHKIENQLSPKSLATLVPVFIDQWISKFVRNSQHPLFKVAQQDGTLRLKASVLGQQLLTLFQAIPLLIGGKRERNDQLVNWYPHKYPRLRLDPKLKRFFDLFRVLDIRGFSDQTGWYNTQPQISAPMLNMWARRLAQSLRHPTFRTRVARWNRSAIEAYHNLHEAVVPEFASSHPDYEVLEFDLELPRTHSNVLPIHLLEDYGKLTKALTLWTRRLAAKSFPRARIAVRIDINPSNQRLIARGLLVTAQSLDLNLGWQLMTEVWQTIDQRWSRRNPTAPERQSVKARKPNAISVTESPQILLASTGVIPHANDRVSRLKQRLAFLGLIPMIERFHSRPFIPAMTVWDFSGTDRRFIATRSF